MTTKNMHLPFKKVNRSLKHRFSLQRFVSSRCAISPVISSMILIAVVIVLGFSALAYARSVASNYQSQYQDNVNGDISKLKETISFEYVYFNSTTQHLSIYFMNIGSNSLEIDKVYLSTSSTAIEPTLRFLSGGLATNKTLGLGDERLIDFSISALSNGSYTVKLTTIRGSSFAYTFVV